MAIEIKNKDCTFHSDHRNLSVDYHIHGGRCSRVFYGHLDGDVRNNCHVVFLDFALLKIITIGTKNNKYL